MVTHISTVAFQGVEVQPVDVQVQISGGLVGFTIVGLADKAVAESRERVRAAIHALGLSPPAKKITVNLAPAGLVKEGAHFDMPIVLGLLVAMEILPAEELSNYICLGEIGLDGRFLPVSGILPAAIEAQLQDKGLICPMECGSEAALAGQDLKVLAPQNLSALIHHFQGEILLPTPDVSLSSEQVSYPDFKDVKGQETAKRALEIAATGEHNLLMSGPPGSGKSMLAARLPSILPELTPSEILQVTAIKSVAGLLKDGQLSKQRPFRDPHHSASLPALIGGGQKGKPGEISLAHQGILFLDEFPEFNRQTLEALRQPIETGYVSIARANAHVTYPAKFQLIVAMNPCPCGYLGDARRGCARAPACGKKYQEKISGPMMDRLDLHVDVPALTVEDFRHATPAESSEEILFRVKQARAFRLTRGQEISTRDLEGVLLEKFCPLEEKAEALLLKAVRHYGLSGRSYHRVLKVARTVADLDQAEVLSVGHIAEALSYRPKTL